MDEPPRVIDLTDDEVHAVLVRAPQIDEARGVDCERTLMAAAEELGISAEALDAARTQVLLDRVEREFEAAFVTERRRQLRTFVITYVVVNLLLIATNAFLENAITWAWAVLFFWSLLLVLMAVGTYVPTSSEYRRLFANYRAEKTAARDLMRELNRDER